MPASETAPNRRALRLNEVVVRTGETLREVRVVRGLHVVRPIVGDVAEERAAVGVLVAAEVRAVVAFGVVHIFITRIRRIADAKTVDRDVLFADDDLVAQTVLYFP